MFQKMIDAGVSAIFVRLLIFVYVHQVANVRWNGEYSVTFTMKNSCGQDKVFSFNSLLHVL